MSASLSAVPRHVPLVYTTRGGLPECVYHGSVAVVDASGRLVASAGDPEALNFTRSALKPFQTLPLVEDDGLGRFGMGSQELAIMCGSHSGEAMHLGVVQGILRRIDADVSDLQCGCHAPSYYLATRQTPPAGAAWSALHHNCSGKHSGFLTYCALHGHRRADYLAPDAPGQVRIRNTLQALIGNQPLRPGVDGCSAPNYAMPLRSLAHLYARLATADSTAPTLQAAAFAMMRHPDLVSGTGRSDLALMAAGEGDWVTKVGADGVQTIGIRSAGLGIAVRVADATTRALNLATLAVLEQLALVSETQRTRLQASLRDFANPPLTNFKGTVVGVVSPAFTLQRH